MLEQVEWGEFKLWDLFEIQSSKAIFHANNIETIFDSQVEWSLPYVVRTTQNNWVRWYIIKDEKFANDWNTLSFAQDTFSVFYQRQRYFTWNKVKILKPKFSNVNENIYQFICACFQKSLETFTRWTGSTVETIAETKIQLPTKNWWIYFDFINKFIAELEAEHQAELEAYLETTWLKNYELTSNELKVLKEFEEWKIEWKEFRIWDLFERINTIKLPYKAKDLPEEPTNENTLPCLTSSFMNQGLNYYVPREWATILKNVISIPSNSDVYRAYFQSNEFTVLSDAYAIRWILDINNILPIHYLFLVSCINQVTDLPIYSYKNKLGWWNVVKNKYIHIPTINNLPNYDFMKNFIFAIEKLTIKDVVLYNNKEIKATKEVINK